jgi:hypothetical protein
MIVNVATCDHADPESIKMAATPDRHICFWIVLTWTSSPLQLNPAQTPSSPPHAPNLSAVRTWQQRTVE